jgi:hypothetical protein
MRRTATPHRAGAVWRAGLAVTALAVLAACSGGGSSSASGSSTTAAPATPTTSSAPATTTPAGPTGADAAFCQQVSALVTDLSTVQSAPAPQVPGLLQRAVAAFEKVRPPAALADDWQTLSEGVHRLQSSLSSVDLTTQEGQAKLQQLEQQATASVSTAEGNITTWVVDHCSPGSAGSSTSAGGTAATNTG